MRQHHYLGDLPKIGHTLWYIATFDQPWVALFSFSGSSLKCAARDTWIGWESRHQYGRLKLIANNSRCLILPDWHLPNVGSKVLALCQRRIRGGYSARDGAPKLVFVRTLQANARFELSRPVMHPRYRQESPKIMLKPEHMYALPSYFKDIADPRRAQGRRHPLPTVLALAAGATLCGMDGYKAMAGWANDLGVKALERFGCRLENRARIVPSESTIREVLMRVDPDDLNRALKRWNADHGQADQSLAIDGKTMCNAIDEAGRQSHIMSVVGHTSGQCYTQKK